MKLGLSRQSSEKISNVKVHGNPSSESRVVPLRKTGMLAGAGRQRKRHDEANSRFSQFCEHAKIRKFLIIYTCHCLTFLYLYVFITHKFVKFKYHLLTTSEDTG
jgi:hypothetical protein